MSAQTLSGTINGFVEVCESAADADLALHVHVYVTEGDSDSVRGTLLADFVRPNAGGEWADAGSSVAYARGFGGAQAISEVTVSEGDRIVVEVGYIARNASATSYTGTLVYGVNQAKTDIASESDSTYTFAFDAYADNPWIEFSGTLSFPAAPGRVTQALVEAVSQGTPAARVSSVVVETITPISVPTVARVSQYVAETVSASVVAARVSQVVIEAITRGGDPCPTVPTGEDLTGAPGPILFAVWDPDGTERGYAGVTLPDPTDYYAGEKAPDLLAVSDVSRALCLGRSWEGARFSVTLADADRSKRALLISGAGAAYIGRGLTVYAVSEAGRKAGSVPALIAAGLVTEAPTFDGSGRLTVTIAARDAASAAQLWTWTGEEQSFPRRLVNRTEFPTAPADVLGKAIPVLYGRWSDAASVIDAPVWAPDAGYGGVTYADGYDLEYGSIAGGPAAPAGVTLTEAAGGSLAAADYTGGKCYAIVTAVDANGIEGDPGPFLPIDAETVISGTGKQITIAWSVVAGAAKYRVYFGHFYFSVYFVQWCEVDAATLSVVVTASPAFGTAPTQSNVTPGWYVGERFNSFFYYGVTAIDGNGDETDPAAVRGVAAEAFGRSYPYPRPIVARWGAVTGADGYRVLRRVAGGTWDTAWTVAAGTLTLADDLSGAGSVAIEGVPAVRGTVLARYVGDRSLASEGAETWRELVVCSHAITGIDGWYLDTSGVIEANSGAGTDYLIPGQSGWSDRFPTPFVDRVDADGVTRRYTVVYARGAKGDAIAAGTSTFRVNLRGVEDSGAGTGDLIEGFYPQAAHLLGYFVFQDYAAGAYGLPAQLPTGVCAVNRPSFLALHVRRGWAGHVGIGLDGAAQTLGDVLGGLMRSGACWFGLSRAWQVEAHAVNPAQSRAAVTTTISDVVDVLADTFGVSIEWDAMGTTVPYRYGAPADGGSEWRGSGTVEDAATIAAWGQRRTASESALPHLRSSVAVAASTAALLADVVAPPTVIEVEGDLSWLAPTFGLGRYVKLTHYRGLGALGYSDRVVYVIGVTVRPGSRTVRLRLLDVHDRIAS